MNKNISRIVALVAVSIMLLAACVPAPVAAPTVAAPVVAPTEAAPVVVPTEAAPVVVPTEAPAKPELPSCGTEPVVLNAYFETGFDIPFKLAEEFTKQYPNVTWDIKQDQFANLITTTPLLLSGDNAPDLLRLPTMVTFAKDGL